MKFKKDYRIELAPTLNGHWYSVYKLGKKEKFLGYFPSSTTILEAYPLSPYLVDWKVAQGAQEADRKLKEAGLRGTNVHAGVEALLNGASLVREGYTLDEWNRLNSFVAWHKEYQPEIVATELQVFSEKYGYCGTLDVLAKVNGVVSLGDWKTSKNIYKHFYLQLASYANALEEMSDVKIEQTFICQFGSNNKDGYRYVIGDNWREEFKTFLSVKDTFEYDRNMKQDFEAPVLNLPSSLKL